MKGQSLEKGNKQINIISGVYPTIIYFPVTNDLFHQPYIQQLIEKLKSQNIQYKLVDQLHLSISKVFHVLQGQAKDLQISLRKYLQIGKLPIILLFDSLQILQNFIVLRCSQITSLKVEEYLKRVNIFLKNLAHQPYFQNPIYHVSICRIAAQDKQRVQSFIKMIKVNKKSFLLERIVLKIGLKQITVK